MPLKKIFSLNFISGASVLFVSIPLIFVIYNSLMLSFDQWLRLWSSRLPTLLWNTLSLAVLVGLLCTLWGVSTAWLISRRAFPGRTVAIWLMVLPLAIPTYVFAHIYTSLLEVDGWLGRLWLGIFGLNSEPPGLDNVWGVALVLALATFPYVFLLARTTLARSNRAFEDVARIQGATPWQVFWSITLPLLRPALVAGLIIVIAHVLSDFGAVSMLRYQTFTLSIYLQISGRFDYQSAAGLSFILVLLSSLFLMLERFFRRRQRYYAGCQSQFVVPKPASSSEQILIWLWLGLIALFAFILPLAWMLSWSWQALTQQLVGREFFVYLGNSITVALSAATIAVVVALPIALYHARQHSVVSSIYLQLSSIGLVLPGPVIALGILTFVLTQIPGLYVSGGITMLIMALVIRFLPLSVQSQDASLQHLTPSIEQAGRVFGAGAIENLWRVILPIIRGGMATAFVLVFIEALKELPATLLLRPTGFDTLPVRIWIEASEEMLELAAPASLMLVAATLPALWIIMRGQGD